MPDNNSSSSTEKKPNSLWAIVAFLVLGVLLVAGYKFKYLLNPKSTLTAALDESCDLRKGACTSDLPNGGKVSFSITPNNIQILRPLTLQVQTEGIEASQVLVDFVGLNMDMGFNRAKLNQEDNMTFKGGATLPVCATTRMDWEARVLLQTDQGLISAPFRFHTIK